MTSKDGSHGASQRKSMRSVGAGFSFMKIDDNMLLGDEFFNELQAQSHLGRGKAPQLQYNYCVECSLPMELMSNEYHCKYCGLTRVNDSELGKSLADVTSNMVTGSAGTRYYSVTNDYTRTQYKMILDQLTAYEKQYTGSSIPKNVIEATAKAYNSIQREVTDTVYDKEGNIKGDKAFVRRAAQKNRVLAAILYYECIRHKCFRKKREIANFMGLKTDGFAKGEDLIRDLVDSGQIDLHIDDETVEVFVDRFMDALNITNQQYYDFVVALVNKSEECNICMNSQLSSKVVGAIWVLIQKYKLPITINELEKATNSTKKSTFTKFSNSVTADKSVFAGIFRQFGIPV
jgi:hypothetical protein